MFLRILLILVQVCLLQVIPPALRLQFVPVLHLPLGYRILQMELELPINGLLRQIIQPGRMFRVLHWQPYPQLKVLQPIIDVWLPVPILLKVLTLIVCKLGCLQLGLVIHIVHQMQQILQILK